MGRKKRWGTCSGWGLSLLLLKPKKNDVAPGREGARNSEEEPHRAHVLDLVPPDIQNRKDKRGGEQNPQKETNELNEVGGGHVNLLNNLRLTGMASFSVYHTTIQKTRCQ